jgi:hypothetical protein
MGRLVSGEKTNGTLQDPDVEWHENDALEKYGVLVVKPLSTKYLMQASNSSVRWKKEAVGNLRDIIRYAMVHENRNVPELRIEPFFVAKYFGLDLN